jgi:hypothetical protein
LLSPEKVFEFSGHVQESLNLKFFQLKGKMYVHTLSPIHNLTDQNKEALARPFYAQLIFQCHDVKDQYADQLTLPIHLVN